MTASLLARLYAAEGGDRELDREIAEDVLGIVTEWLSPVNSPVKVLCFMPYRHEGTQAPVSVEVPTYTASIDAALTLVPEGAGWNVHGNTDVFYAAVKGCTSGQSKKTPAIALCIAALKARGLPQ